MEKPRSPVPLPQYRQARLAVPDRLRRTRQEKCTQPPSSGGVLTSEQTEGKASADLLASQRRARPKQGIEQLGNEAPIYTEPDGPEGAEVAKTQGAFRKGNFGFPSSAGR